VSRKYFGTDGVRGTVGEMPITPEFVLRLGQAAGRALTSTADGHRPAVLIGKDTRISGYMLEAALEAGLSSAGGMRSFWRRAACTGSCMSSGSRPPRARERGRQRGDPGLAHFSRRRVAALFPLSA
jgi:hypothetical protein